jgi:hypothetical protein
MHPFYVHELEAVHMAMPVFFWINDRTEQPSLGLKSMF